jgi:hypothetical protein
MIRGIRFICRVYLFTLYHNDGWIFALGSVLEFAYLSLAFTGQLIFMTGTTVRTLGQPSLKIYLIFSSYF